MRGNSLILIIPLLAVLAAGQEPAPAPSTSNFFVCDCPGESDGKDYVCGADSQTYGNECLLKCSNMALAYKGECNNKGCYPYGEEICTGNFDDMNPICTIGLTFSLAEAQCGGTGQGTQCTTQGVCNYRDDGQPSYLPTTGGKGLDWKKAADNTALPSKSDAPYNYSEALAKLLLFYDTMISGNLTAPGVCRRRLTWRSNSCSGCVGKYGEDLSGGFYEAGGSSLKFPSIISGFSGTMLAWAGLEFGPAIDRAGSLEDLKWKVKWAADHVINAHPQPEVFCGYIGNYNDNFDDYGPVEYYEKYNPAPLVGYVTAKNPGSEIAADAAATIAAAIALLGDADPAWKENALQHATELYGLATKYQKSFADSKDEGIQQINDLYPSNNGFYDDLAWAALWMHKATGEASYLTDAKKYFDKAPPLDEGATFETGYKTPGVAILLAAATKDSAALDVSRKYFDNYLSGYVRHTKAGAAYPYHWGAMRHVGNLGFLTFVHAKNEAVDRAYAARLINYGMHQTNYIMGDAGRSWIVGFGQDYPTTLNHKYSYFNILNWHPDPEVEIMGKEIWMTDVEGNWAPQNKTGYVQRAKFDFEGSRNPQQNTPWGAVFGAPLYDDSLINTRRDYSYSECTIEYNAGVVGAAAALADWYSTGPWTDVESLEDVIPYTCDEPEIPFIYNLTAEAPAPSAPAPAPLVIAPVPVPELVLVPAPQPAAVVPPVVDVVVPSEDSTSTPNAGSQETATTTTSAAVAAQKSYCLVLSTLSVFIYLFFFFF